MKPNEISAETMELVTVHAEIVIPCDTRQANLLRQDPSKAFVAVRGSVVKNAVIVETEVIDKMSAATLEKTIKARIK